MFSCCLELRLLLLRRRLLHQLRKVCSQGGCVLGLLLRRSSIDGLLRRCGLRSSRCRIGIGLPLSTRCCLDRRRLRISAACYGRLGGNALLILLGPLLLRLENLIRLLLGAHSLLHWHLIDLLWIGMLCPGLCRVRMLLDIAITIRIDRLLIRLLIILILRVVIGVLLRVHGRGGRWSDCSKRMLMRKVMIRGKQKKFNM